MNGFGGFMGSRSEEPVEVGPRSPKMLKHTTCRIDPRAGPIQGLVVQNVIAKKLVNLDPKQTPSHPHSMKL